MTKIIVGAMAAIACFFGSAALADTVVIGPPDAVTAVDGLSFSVGSVTYSYNVQFVEANAGDFGASAPYGIPTFLNNMAGSQAAATALASTLSAYGATQFSVTDSFEGGQYGVGAVLIADTLTAQQAAGPLVYPASGGWTWDRETFQIGIDPLDEGIALFTPVPLPASAWLLLVGLVALGVYAPKRRYSTVEGFAKMTRGWSSAC